MLRVRVMEPPCQVMVFPALCAPVTEHSATMAATRTRIRWAVRITLTGAVCNVMFTHFGTRDVTALDTLHMNMEPHPTLHPPMNLPTMLLPTQFPLTTLLVLTGELLALTKIRKKTLVPFTIGYKLDI